MPDQPADPLHYDMKIPPEPPKSNDKAEPEKGSSEATSAEKVPAKDSNAETDKK